MKAGRNKEVGERLRQLMRVLGMTQEEVGGRLGINRSLLSKVLSGNQRLSNLLMRALESEFGVSPAWLREGVGEMFLQREQPPAVEFRPGERFPMYWYPHIPGERPESMDLFGHLVSDVSGTYVFRVADGTLSKAWAIRKGDLLIVDRFRKAEKGDMVMALCDGELLLLRLREEKGEPVLEDLGPPRKRYPMVQLWGVVAFVVHKTAG